MKRNLTRSRGRMEEMDCRSGRTRDVVGWHGRANSVFKTARRRAKIEGTVSNFFFSEKRKEKDEEDKDKVCLRKKAKQRKRKRRKESKKEAFFDFFGLFFFGLCGNRKDKKKRKYFGFFSKKAENKK